MAVTLATLKSEAQARFSEDTSTTSGIFTDAFVLSVVNEFYDEREVDMRLEINPTDYTVAAAATSVALSTVSTSLISVRKIEVLNDDDDVTSEIEPRPQGDTYGFFVYNGYIHFNGRSTDSTSLDIRVWGFRKATRHTATSENADVHSNSERSVLLPLLLARGYERARKFNTADGYMRRHEDAFKRMMVKRTKQENELNPVITASEAYSPMTG